MTVLSAGQTLSLLLLFQIGSNVIFGFASGAKQDAWIAAGISMIAGLLLISIYCQLLRWHPEKNWVLLLIHLYGRLIGNIVAFAYILLFIYLAGRVLRDFGHLLLTYVLPKTPMGFTMFLFVFLAGYACYSGLERIGRLAQIFVPMVVIFLSLQFVLLIASGMLHFEWLLPVAQDWRRIATTVFPLGMMVPFGETLAFAMFWCFTVQPAQYRSAALYSACFVGLLFIILDVFAVATLGADIFSRAIYPLLTTFQMISVADFLENVDPIVVTNFEVAGFFKITVFTFAACMGIATQFKLKTHRSVVVPVCLLVLLMAMFMTENVVSHIFVGLSWVPWVLHIPFFVIIPVVSLIVAAWKRNGGKQDANEASGRVVAGDDNLDERDKT